MGVKINMLETTTKMKSWLITSFSRIVGYGLQNYKWNQKRITEVRNSCIPGILLSKRIVDPVQL